MVNYGQRFEERGFRRGYLRGFQEAVDAMKKLQDGGLSLDEAYTKCKDFAAKDLDQWRYGNLDQPTPPPVIS